MVDCVSSVTWQHSLTSDVRLLSRRPAWGGGETDGWIQTGEWSCDHGMISALPLNFLSALPPLSHSSWCHYAFCIQGLTEQIGQSARITHNTIKVSTGGSPTITFRSHFPEFDRRIGAL